tara:strand:- start:45204 stop:46376 length:1173 start_codon:yes stop_codon:yes gene_type:complete
MIQELFSKSEALSQMHSFVESKANRYQAMRNYDFGKLEENYVSGLSPAISRRIITEEVFLKTILKSFSFSRAEKLIQEVCWRTYWKGYLENRSQIWTNYLTDLINLKYLKASQEYKTASEGKTEIECFNKWINELVGNGYLHNHTRMWFSSIWIHTLKLPWQLGAELFMKFLLDADPASNTLSWRWVAGNHTLGKTYLANPSNIKKFTGGRLFPENQLALQAKETNQDGTIEVSTVKIEKIRNPEFVECLLVHENDLSFENIPLSNILLIQDKSLLAYDRSKFVRHFIDDALIDCKNRITKQFDKEIQLLNFDRIDALKDLVAKREIKIIHTPYPAVGALREKILQIEKLVPVKINFLYSKWDQAFWPHADRGFFKLKKKIPEIINSFLT